MADVPGYRCGRCDFFLCDRCHERAENHLKMTEEIDKTLKDTAKVEWMQSKLMVVGEGAAGKTSTVRTLLGLKFNKNWDSTVGANLTQATAGEDGEHAWGEVGEDEKIDHVIKAAVQQMDEKQIPKSSFKKRLPFGRNLVRFFREQRKLHAEQRKMLREMERIEKNMTEEEREELERVRRAQRQARAPKREKGEGLKLDAAAVAGKLTMESVQKANEKKDLIQFTIWDYGESDILCCVLKLLRYIGCSLTVMCQYRRSDGFLQSASHVSYQVWDLLGGIQPPLSAWEEERYHSRVLTVLDEFHQAPRCRSPDPSHRDAYRPRQKAKRSCERY